MRKSLNYADIAGNIHGIKNMKGGVIHDNKRGSSRIRTIIS